MNRTYIDVPLEIVEASADDVDEFSEEHDMASLNVRFKLVYSGVNNNGDRFTDDILRQNFKTLENKLINWEHDEPNIGVITKARLVEATKTTPLHVECDGVIMRIKYPEYADIIESSAGLGQLGLTESRDKHIAKMSMEAYFHDADYIIGDYEQRIPLKDDRTGMLAEMLGSQIGGKLLSRELKDCTFSGAAVTVNPAEKRAVLMAAASNKRPDGKEKYKDLPTVSFAFASRRIFPIDTLARAMASYEYFDDVARLLDPNYETVPELVEAHQIIQDRLADNGLPELVHACRICKEGGNENMAGKTKKSQASEEELQEPVAEVEEIVAEVTTDTEPSPESEEPVASDAEEVPADSEVVTEPMALDEPSAELEAEAELELEAAESEEEGLPTEPNSGEPFEQLSVVMNEVRDLLKDLKQHETKASEDDRLSDLEAQLATATTRAQDAETSVLGLKRAVSLANKGLTTLASLEEKASRYGAMENSTWLAYVEDLKSIKESTKVDEETKVIASVKKPQPTTEAEEVLIFEAVEKNPADNYRAYVMSMKRSNL